MSKVLGIALLFGMGFFKESWKDWKVIVPVYIVRTVLMNSTTPLHKSILMDHCVKGSRGRWNAADSITALGFVLPLAYFFSRHVAHLRRTFQVVR